MTNRQPGQRQYSVTILNCYAFITYMSLVYWSQSLTLFQRLLKCFLTRNIKLDDVDKYNFIII